MPTSPTRSRAATAVIASSALLTLGIVSAWATPEQRWVEATPAAPLAQNAGDDELAHDWESSALFGDVDPTFDTGDLPPSFDAPSWSSAQLTPVPGANAWFVAPVPGPVTSAFGLRFHPILLYTRMHNGVDMTAGCGTPVAAAAAGQVTFVGPNGGYGNLVVIDHGIVSGARMQTKYAHLSAFSTKVGDTVNPGTQIGLAGTTGLSTGCHLHFEVKLNGVYVNPSAFLTGAPTVIPTLPPGATTTMPTEASALKSRIRFCESSNNYLATNPTSTASGAYQFLDGTWAMIPTSITGGTARALYATPAQQDAAFDWLFARDGSRPWLASQACWGSVLNVPTTVLSVAQTAAATAAATATETPTATPTETATETPTPTPSATETPSATPSATESPSASATPTTGTTPTPSDTPPASTTPSATTTPTEAAPEPEPEPVTSPEPVTPTQTATAPAPTTAEPTKTATVVTSEPAATTTAAKATATATAADTETTTPKASASATPTLAPEADG